MKPKTLYLSAIWYSCLYVGSVIIRQPVEVVVILWTLAFIFLFWGLYEEREQSKCKHKHFKIVKVEEGQGESQ